MKWTAVVSAAYQVFQPASVAALAEVDVIHVDEDRLVECADLVECLASNEHHRAAHPAWLERTSSVVVQIYARWGLVPGSELVEAEEVARATAHRE